jgi:hypothetical protein
MLNFREDANPILKQTYLKGRAAVSSTPEIMSVFHRITPNLLLLLIGRNIILAHNAVCIALNFTEICISHSKTNVVISLNIWQKVQTLELSLYFTGLLFIYHGV